MNKTIKTFFFGFLICSIFNCKGVKKNIVIDQSETRYPIIIKSAKDNANDIINIQFPNKIIIKNNSFSEKKINQVRYIYINIPPNRDYRIGLFQEFGNDLKKISYNKKKTISSNDHISLVYYTRHFIDSSRNTQQQFKPYIEKMLLENKDTLHIGTVTEFKKKHKELFEKLTKNDSISIRFLDGKKLGERITVPVKW